MADDLRRREIVRSRRALSRALTRVSRARIDELLALSSGRDAARQGRSVAVTGPAGVGKSTLIARLAPLRLARARAEDPARADLLAVLAIDPSSPVSGGAILGDRVRMDAVADDLGLFLRSIASGGAYGGLSRDIVSLVTATLDHGFAEVIVETVGAGQSDVAAADLAETVVLVLQPDSGDMVQAIGPMDEGYFLYFEDTEYCLRARRAGWRLASIPKARAIHFRGGSAPVKALARERKRLPAYYYASRARFLHQAHGRAGLWAANLLWHLGRGIASARRLAGKAVPATNDLEARDIWINAFNPTGDSGATR